jgi:hypothetical protein
VANSKNWDPAVKLMRRCMNWRKVTKTEELKLKGRELAILEKKSETEIDLLKIKEKKELLPTQKELKDAGDSLEKIDVMLPIT